MDCLTTACTKDLNQEVIYIDLDEESSQAETVIKMTLNNYYTAGSFEFNLICIFWGEIFLGENLVP